MKNQTKIKNKKIISLIPNVLTTIALSFGLLSIFNIIKLLPLTNQEFIGIETEFLTEKALWWSCIFIYIAAFVDFVDGRIARLLKNDSEFGMHYDSLSDLICFGLAPSLLIYIVYLSSYGKIGMMCSIFLTICVALRLSRFNTLSHNQKNSFFVGLPSPMGAGLIVSLILIDYKFVLLSKEDIEVIFLIFSPIVGMLMVSNIIFTKKIFPNKIRRFKALIIISIGSVAILTHIEIGSFVLFYSYLIFTLIRFSISKYRKRHSIASRT